MGRNSDGRGGQRVDRNGIPILDPPSQANKLKPLCHPSEHIWAEVDDRFTGEDHVMDIEYRVIESRCKRCGAQHLDSVAIDRFERRNG